VRCRLEPDSLVMRPWRGHPRQLRALLDRVDNRAERDSWATTRADLRKRGCELVTDLLPGAADGVGVGDPVLAAFVAAGADRAGGFRRALATRYGPIRGS
jgi:hypothetical protein